jgi:Phage integrase, N-terminal SAM-like domain
MFEQLFSSESARRRHGDAPFADERARYLRHCAEQGATRATLRMKAKELLWLARHLGPGATAGVDMDDLQSIAHQRQCVCRGATTTRRLINIARPWLKFLGWWRTPAVEFRFQSYLDQYVTWMWDERGLSRQTVERWHAHARAFLQWCEKTDQRLATLQPTDIDRYLIDEGARRWSRVSISNTASALRAFLRSGRSQVGPQHISRHRSSRRRALGTARGPRWSLERKVFYSLTLAAFR